MLSCLLCGFQDAGGVGPGLVSHTAEQHRVFPASCPQPAPPAQTLPHRQPHGLWLGHRGTGRRLSLVAAPWHTGYALTTHISRYLFTNTCIHYLYRMVITFIYSQLLMCFPCSLVASSYQWVRDCVSKYGNSFFAWSQVHSMLTCSWMHEWLHSFVFFVGS